MESTPASATMRRYHSMRVRILMEGYLLTTKIPIRARMPNAILAVALNGDCTSDTCGSVVSVSIA